MGLIFCMFVHIAIRNNHTKFRVNRKIFRYILRRGHFDPPPHFKFQNDIFESQSFNPHIFNIFLSRVWKSFYPHFLHNKRQESIGGGGIIIWIINQRNQPATYYVNNVSILNEPPPFTAPCQLNPHIMTNNMWKYNIRSRRITNNPAEPPGLVPPDNE